MDEKAKEVLKLLTGMSFSEWRKIRDAVERQFEAEKNAATLTEEAAAKAAFDIKNW